MKKVVMNTLLFIVGSTFFIALMQLLLLGKTDFCFLACCFAGGLIGGAAGIAFGWWKEKRRRTHRTKRHRTHRTKRHRTHRTKRHR